MSDPPKTQPKPARKQQQRSLRTQEKLLDAAAEAFAENGFSGTSTRDIAERAGVHHPLITYHFRNKEELWRAAADRVYRRFRGTLAVKRASLSGTPPRERTAELLRTFIEFAAKNPELHKIMFQESGHDNPRIAWLIERHLKPVFEIGVQDLSLLQEAGIAPAGNTALLYNLMRMCGGALLALKIEVKGTTGLDLDQPEMQDELIDLIVNVFLPGDAHDDEATAETE